MPIALLVGWAFGGPGVGASAAIACALVGLNFCANGLSLAWASRISPRVLRVVALGGYVVRMGAIVGVMFALDTQAWFTPLAFGWALVAATVLLLAHGARLAHMGVGGALELPAHPALVRAASLAAREASLDAD